MKSEFDSNKIKIGRNVHIDLIDYSLQVPAKVDTGADSSAISASNIEMLQDGTLQFTLFDKKSPHYDGKRIKTTQYSVAKVRSTTGHQEIRYRVFFSVRIKGKRIRVAFNLSNRSQNRFPILIGRRTISNKFIVDVTMADDNIKLPAKSQTQILNEELITDPYAFFKKYHGKDL
jgi:hypothetical protein